jgi:ribosomal protein L37AE/L43A
MNNKQIFICEDCNNSFNTISGGYYKYEPTIWLCDDCEAERIQGDESDDGI